MDIKKQIKIALGLDTEEVVLGFQAKTEDGTIIVSTAEELEAGVDISVLTEDGTTILLPVGTYKLDTGVSFRVEEEGIVGEVIESETEEEETPKEELAEEDDKDDYDEEADVADWKGMEKRIKNLEDAVADLKSEIGETGDVEEMTEETVEETTEPSTNPRTKTTKTTEVVEFSAEDELEKLKAENEKLKTELAESPADAPVNTNKFSTDRPTLNRTQYNKLSKHERFLYNLNK
jgi:hypothetical protein|tara:strand:- start:430 stop:1131 length:702 start_codon:yes stop_codon:yes gene_type:complete